MSKLPKIPFGNRKNIGLQGEEVAVSVLKSQGYRILARNYKARYGEIDAVAQDGATLCFVEVKARRSLALGFPEEGITSEKQWRLTRLAQGYLQRHGLHDCPVRFDVVSILFDPRGEVARTRLIKGAFESWMGL